MTSALGGAPRNELFRQRMSLGQLVRVPGREPMPNRLVGDLILRHGCDDLVVHEQSVHVQRLVARRIGCFELNRAAALSIFDAGEQRRLEQLGFVLEFFHLTSSEQLEFTRYAALAGASRGGNPNARRKARANWLAEPKPVASAISTTASDVSRNNWRARSNRSAR